MSNRIIMRGLVTKPDSFSFTPVTNAEPGATYSTSVIPTGYDFANWSVTNGQGSTDNSNWSTSGTIRSGQTFYIRGTAGTFLNATTVTATIGGTSANFVISSRAADITPANFDFNNVTGASVSTQYTSNPVTVTGLEPNYPVTITATGGTIDAGTTSLSGSFESSKTVTTSGSGTIQLAARLTSSANAVETVSMAVTVGSGYDTGDSREYFSVTTAIGSAVYTTPGTYNWTVPAGVTSVCVVCVGAGGHVRTTRAGSAIGGPGGGELRYKNNISVTPGTVWKVNVGLGGNTDTGLGVSAAHGNSSSFVSPGNSTIVLANGGRGGDGSDSAGDASASAGAGGSGGIGDGGGNGGSGGTTSMETDTNNGLLKGGGGGAGGYSGTGGNGVSGKSGLGLNGVAVYPTNGSGGGGGGGGAAVPTSSGTTGRGMGGGGVGLFGQGSNGTAGPVEATSGASTSSYYSGSPGSGGNGELYGGGRTAFSGPASPGAVRIIWGAGKSYPNNAT